MRNFRKAIYDSLHHWPAIVLATVCAMGVAFLWTANIGALWPVIEITLKGDSIQDWLRADIVATEANVKALQSSCDAMVTVVDDPSLPPLTSDDLRLRSKQKEDILARVESEKAKIERSRNFVLWAEYFLPSSPFATVCWIMGMVLVSTVVKHVLLLVSELLIAHVSTDIVRSLRMRLFARALGMDRKTFQSHGTSGMLANITTSADGLATGLTNFFGAAVREPLRIIACLIGACYFNWRLLVFSLILAPLLIITVQYFSQKIRSISTSILGRNAGFHEIILEALSNIFTVQAFTMENQEQERFSQCTRGMKNISMKMVLYMGLGRPVTELIGVGMVAITVCAGAYLVINKATHIFYIRFCDEPMTISSLFAFFALLIGASDPLRKLSGVFTSIHMGSICANALYGILDTPPVLTLAANPTPAPDRHRVLQVEEVSFHYDPNLPILKKVNLTIPFGRTIAILGPNGSGKSTLIQLLGRYYDPIQGTIKLDDIDYKNLAIYDIRKRIAIVSQNTELFNRSVLENIQYGSPNSSREEAIEAAKMAHAHSFISETLSNGYETIVGQGGQKLSGGQRQRMALARAILRNPEILILDESTSQIDMASELLIRESLETMKGRFTIIIITHREALVALADDVYHVRDGQLVPETTKTISSAA